jgi:hypothetical protein
MTLLRRFWDAAGALDASARDRDEGSSMPFCTPDRPFRLTARAWIVTGHTG